MRVSIVGIRNQCLELIQVVLYSTTCLIIYSLFQFVNYFYFCINREKVCAEEFLILLPSYNREDSNVQLFGSTLCCGNYQLQRPIITQSSKSLSRILSRDYKRTQQGVSAKLLSYLYRLHMVCATNNYFCPNVHASSISALYVYYKVAVQLTHFLMSFI